MPPREKLEQSSAVRVLIVDDHPLVRHAMKRFLEDAAHAYACAEASDAVETFALVESFKPDIVLLDLELKRDDGLGLTKRIKTQWPGLPILILTLHDEALYAERALRSGASGYLTKSEAPETLFKAIKEVLSGSIYASQRVKQRLIRDITQPSDTDGTALLRELSNRELKVFQLIGEGYTTRQIAEELQLSVKTVESHRANIKKKTQLGSAAELAHFAASYVKNKSL